MKHHVHLIIYFACISVGILLCACRSSSLHSNQFKENGTFQHNYNELNTGTGTIERYPVKPYKENPGQRPGKIAK